MKYQIIPNGLIKGGTFDYSYDPSSEKLHYDLHGQAGTWFKTVDIDQSGDEDVKKEFLSSDHFKKAGAPISFGPLAGKVTALDGNIATADLTLAGQNCTGVAKFSLAGPYAELLNLDAVGSIVLYGFSFSYRLIVVPATKTSLSKNHTRV